MSKLFSFPLLRRRKEVPLIAKTREFLVRGKRFTVDDYYIVDDTPIGSGAYGDVCSGTNIKLRYSRVAIKKISNCFGDLVDAKRILREVKMLTHFDHPNIVSIVDMIPPKRIELFKDVYICLELVDIDLQKLLRSRKRELELSTVKYLTYQLLCAVKYIHSARVMHRDLKPSNLLICISDWTLKLCDFGLARPIEYEAEITEYVVTRWYRAPEIICACEQYDEHSDLWSVGCILMEMFTRFPLFKGKNYLQQLELIFTCLGTGNDLSWVSHQTARRFLETLPATPLVPFAKKFCRVDSLALDLAGRFLESNPAKRISIDEALTHPFVEDCHVPGMETVCSEAFDHSYEDSVNTEQELKSAMFGEIVAHRRAAQKLQRAWF